MAQGTLASTGLLFFGTLSSLFNKIIYGLKGKGSNHKTKFFRKPWASTAIMFVGMAFCLPLSLLGGLFDEKKKDSSEDSSSLGERLLNGGQNNSQDEQNKTSIKWKDALLVAVPTIFDLAATVLMSIGLLSVTASVYQMLRGAEMLFAALFSVTFLRRSLTRKHYIGLLCCFVGIILVGGSSLINGSGGAETNANQIIIGMLLIVLAQAVQAAQVTVEDHVLRDIGVAPLTVVGWEGCWGCLFMFAILLPIVQYLPGEDGSGLHEDSIDSWHMITHSMPGWAIPTVLILTGFSLLMYNVTGMFVTDSIGAVARTVLESLRTLFVWLADLALFYVIPLPKGLGEIGEKWDRSSYLQALGFVVLVAGTVIYGRGDEEQESQHAEEHKSFGIQPPKLSRPLFRNHSISGWSHNGKRIGKWRAAVAAAVAQARMQGEDHA